MDRWIWQGGMKSDGWWDIIVNQVKVASKRPPGPRFGPIVQSLLDGSQVDGRAVCFGPSAQSEFYAYKK